MNLEEEIKNKIKDIGENEDCNEVEFESLLSYIPKKNKYKASDGFITGLYKFYTSSQDKILYRDNYEFEDTCILIGRGGVPSLHLSSKFSVSHDDVYVIKLKNKNEISLQFIFYYLKLNLDLISNTFKGSTIKHCSKEELSKIKIKIPKNKQLIIDMNPLFEDIEILQYEMKEAEILYKQYINELYEEALPNKIYKKDNLSEEKLLEISKNNNKLEEPIIKVSKKKISKNNDELEESIIKVSKKKVSKKDDLNNSSEESLLGLTNKQISKDDDLIKTSKKKVIKKKVIIQNTI